VKLASVALLAALAFAQSPVDARRVLQEAFDAASAPGTWFVEGRYITEAVSDVYTTRRTGAFRVWKSGQDWRTENDREAVYPSSSYWPPHPSGFWIKNGPHAWRASEPWAPYEFRQVREDLRAPAYFRWEDFPTTLQNAVFAGRERIEFEGRDVECVVIQSKSPHDGLRTFYVDPSSKMMLRERYERTQPCNSYRASLTATCTRIERDLPIDPALFTFTPPPGAVQGDPLAPFINRRVYRAGGDVSAPIPIYRVDATYTPDSIDAMPRTPATVHVEVSPFGRPGRMWVLSGPGGDLNEKALGAVRGWCFLPGRKGGDPVVVSTTVDVDFRLSYPAR